MGRSLNRDTHLAVLDRSGFSFGWLSQRSPFGSEGIHASFMSMLEVQDRALHRGKGSAQED